jgi:hypothetical protein
METQTSPRTGRSADAPPVSAAYFINGLLAVLVVSPVIEQCSTRDMTTVIFVCFIDCRSPPRRRLFATAKVDDLVWALTRIDERTGLSLRALARPLYLLLSA